MSQVVAAYSIDAEHVLLVYSDGMKQYHTTASQVPGWHLNEEAEADYRAYLGGGGRVQTQADAKRRVAAARQAKKGKRSKA
jgi:hypothetical protein